MSRISRNEFMAIYINFIEKLKEDQLKVNETINFKDSKFSSSNINQSKVNISNKINSTIKIKDKDKLTLHEHLTTNSDSYYQSLIHVYKESQIIHTNREYTVINNNGKSKKIKLKPLKFVNTTVRNKPIKNDVVQFKYSPLIFPGENLVSVQSIKSLKEESDNLELIELSKTITKKRQSSKFRINTGLINQNEEIRKSNSDYINNLSNINKQLSDQSNNSNKNNDANNNFYNNANNSSKFIRKKRPDRFRKTLLVNIGELSDKVEKYKNENPSPIEEAKNYKEIILEQEKEYVYSSYLEDYMKAYYNIDNIYNPPDSTFKYLFGCSCNIFKSRNDSSDSKHQRDSAKTNAKSNKHSLKFNPNNKDILFSNNISHTNNHLLNKNESNFSKLECLKDSSNKKDKDNTVNSHSLSNLGNKKFNTLEKKINLNNYTYNCETNKDSAHKNLINNVSDDVDDANKISFNNSNPMSRFNVSINNKSVIFPTTKLRAQNSLFDQSIKINQTHSDKLHYTSKPLNDSSINQYVKVLSNNDTDDILKINQQNLIFNHVSKFNVVQRAHTALDDLTNHNNTNTKAGSQNNLNTQQILNNWNANDKHDNSKSNNLHHEKTGSFKNTLSSKEITKIKISSCNNNEIDQSNNKDQMQSKKESAMFFKNDNNTIPSMFDLKLEHDDENSRKKSMISNKSKDSKDSREKILKTKSYIPIFYNNLLEKSQKNTKTDLHNILNTKNEFNSKKDLKVKIYKEFKKDIIRPQKSLSDNKINRMDSACFEINKSSKAILNKAKYQSTLNIKHPNKTEIKRSSKMTLYDNIIESPKTVTKLENKNDNNVEQGKKLLNLFNATMPLEKEFLQQIPITKNSIKSSSNNKSSFSDNSNSNNKNKNKNKRKHSSLKKLKLPNKFAKKSRHSSGINNENSINFTSEVKLSNSLNTIEVNLHMRLTETMKTHKLNNPILLGFSSNLTEESFGVNDEEMHYINLCSNAFCILDDNKIDYKRVNSLSYKLNCFNKKELVNKIRYPFVLNGNVFLERVDFFRNFEGKTKIFPMNSSQLSDYQVKIKDDENFSCNKFISRKINDDFSFEYLKLTKSPDVFPVFLVNYIEPNENIPVFQLNEINYTIFSEALESIESLNYETIVVCLVKKSSHNVISFLIKFIIQHYFINNNGVLRNLVFNIDFNVEEFNDLIRDYDLNSFFSQNYIHISINT